MYTSMVDGGLQLTGWRLFWVRFVDVVVVVADNG